MMTVEMVVVMAMIVMELMCLRGFLKRKQVI